MYLYVKRGLDGLEIDERLSEPFLLLLFAQVKKKQ